MGVPGFFRWLLNKCNNNTYNKIDTTKTPTNIDVFYIDANGIFHPQAFAVIERYTVAELDKKSIDALEGEMIREIINYLKRIIDIVNPNMYVYLAVDGVAPMAKIKQQRQRRYKSVLESDKKTEIYNKYNKERYTKWTNACITPGTNFMEKLNLELVNIRATSGVLIKYTSCYEPGEGEHKIMNDIRNSHHKKIIIHGLDADLIFLSLASNHNNIYLMREDIIPRRTDDSIVDEVATPEFDYISINKTKSLICNIVRDMTNATERVVQDRIIKDFIVLCYLLGNDFLPHIPSIRIAENGLDFLLQEYCKMLSTLPDPYLLSVNQREGYKEAILNVEAFRHLFLGLGNKEDSFFKNDMKSESPMQQSYRHEKRYSVPEGKTTLDVELEKELDQLNLLDLAKTNLVSLGIGSKAEYKYRYYNYYYPLSSNKDLETITDSICRCYLEGIKWVTEYYFNGCCSWSWQYLYYCAPFISDLAGIGAPYVNNINNITFELDTPLTPPEQLLMVIPPRYNWLLPLHIRQIQCLTEIEQYFPTKIELDILLQTLFWKCEAKIPIIKREDIIQYFGQD